MAMIRVALFPVAGHAEVVDRIVAVVNEDIILLTELEAAVQPYMEKIKSSGYPPEKEQQMRYRVREDMIDKLVDEKLTAQEIKANNLRVEENEVDQMIERVKQANYYSDEEFRKALELGGLTLDTYRGQLKEQILRNKLVTLEVKSKIVVTTEDIKAYYDAHPELYGGKRQYHLRNIFLKYPFVGPTDPDRTLQERFDPVIRQLESGVPFEQLARQYSESSTAADGGYLGQFSLESLSGEIRDNIKNLSEGQYTPVIKSEQGGQVILVEKIEQSGDKPLEAVKDEVEQKLFKEIMDKKFKEWIENLRSRSHIKVIR